jgi:hypothetical protein
MRLRFWTNGLPLFIPSSSIYLILFIFSANLFAHDYSQSAIQFLLTMTTSSLEGQETASHHSKNPPSRQGDGK